MVSSIDICRVEGSGEQIQHDTDAVSSSSFHYCFGFRTVMGDGMGEGLMPLFVWLILLIRMTYVLDFADFKLRSCTVPSVLVLVSY